jgi:hypothetical protein
MHGLRAKLPGGRHALVHQINEYWKMRIGKPSFQERGWVVVNALTVFDSAYNKG